MSSLWGAFLLAGAALQPAQAIDAPAGVEENEPVRAEPVFEYETGYRDISFVPRGWKLYDKAEGDLDGDGRTDSVLIIQGNDPALIITKTQGLGMDYYDANPRAVVVLLQDHHGQYRLAAKSLTIIPDHSQPTISDPYEMMRIEDGSLYLNIAFFANAGSWSMSNQQFQFRWDGKAMALIGYESNEVRRNTGEMRQTSVNYLSRKRKDAVGNIEDEDDETDWKWSDVPRSQRYTLGSIGNGYDFRP